VVGCAKYQQTKRKSATNILALPASHAGGGK
jgi:hypothetical protein